jgi:hypothetical protein
MGDWLTQYFGEGRAQLKTVGASDASTIDGGVFVCHIFFLRTVIVMCG